MALENVTGNLLAYNELEPGTFQHVDQLTIERRTNHELRNQGFYTADGELYTVQKRKQLWVITREPQNLVLENIEEAYRQLTGQGNYFPDADAAQTSLEHEDSVVVNLEGLKLVKHNNHQYGHFVVDPKAVKKLNPEQRKAAKRVYGPDEENFGLNMEMFAKAGKTLYVFVLMPDYVQGTLRSNDKKFVGRASWLDNFSDYFYAIDRVVSLHLTLRGVRHVIAEGDAPENEVPPAPQEMKQDQSVVVTLERMLELSRPHVSDSSWPTWKETLRKEYKQ
ncbi:hypothetical protein COV17_01910 [Candidatus Woesearchaeota archaeon CG10_big_fil_rev_8_21_14_0_10_36_11]|nr:MAG: hypothetical protein COV17_01910 [Candidatus Woesearchaeota archaeon CG10_big_fil_rev_8_21_14_0_10_36_11]